MKSSAFSSQRLNEWSLRETRGGSSRAARAEAVGSTGTHLGAAPAGKSRDRAGDLRGGGDPPSQGRGIRQAADDEREPGTREVVGGPDPGGRPRTEVREHEWTELSGGEVIVFDSKWLHAAEPIEPERWTVVLWQIKYATTTQGRKVSGLEPHQVRGRRSSMGRQRPEGTERGNTTGSAAGGERVETTKTPDRIVVKPAMVRSGPASTLGLIAACAGGVLGAIRWEAPRVLAVTGGALLILGVKVLICKATSQRQWNACGRGTRRDW